MGILIGLKEFDGPFFDTKHLKDGAGVYVILYGAQSRYQFIDVGHAENMRASISNNYLATLERVWPEPVLVAAFYTPYLTLSERQTLADDIQTAAERVAEAVAC